jgi:carboxymethylenebutenolidase
MLEDVREIARTEAATKEFAALHKEPLAFKLEELAGKRVSFTTPDGKSASAYEIRNKKKTNNIYSLSLMVWLNDYIRSEAELLANELNNVNVIALDLYDGKVATTADSANEIHVRSKA